MFQGFLWGKKVEKIWCRSSGLREWVVREPRKTCGPYSVSDLEALGTSGQSPGWTCPWSQEKYDAFLLVGMYLKNDFIYYKENFIGKKKMEFDNKG